MNAEEIKQYWSDRAEKHPDTATTNDVFLRRIEQRALNGCIYRYVPRLVADIGCGDGRTTRKLAKAYPLTNFAGLDFSPSMIRQAQTMPDLSNLAFNLHDISQPLLQRYDLIYTTRCLINLSSWEDQQQAIRNIYDSLLDDGIYVMIENFIEGHDAINKQRELFGLKSLAVRPHNLYFHKHHVMDFASTLFSVIEDVNISSTYYLVTRVLYARMCANKGIEPDYLDEHHEIAADLPYAGEYGPTRMVVMRRR